MLDDLVWSSCIICWKMLKDFWIHLACLHLECRSFGSWFGQVWLSFRWFLMIFGIKGRCARHLLVKPGENGFANLVCLASFAPFCMRRLSLMTSFSKPSDANPPMSSKQVSTWSFFFYWHKVGAVHSVQKSMQQSLSHFSLTQSGFVGSGPETCASAQLSGPHREGSPRGCPRCRLFRSHAALEDGRRCPDGSGSSAGCQPVQDRWSGQESGAGAGCGTTHWDEFQQSGADLFQDRHVALLKVIRRCPFYLRFLFPVWYYLVTPANVGKLSQWQTANPRWKTDAIDSPRMGEKTIHQAEV